jgi:LysR family transcriptional activator of dmlA
VNKEVPPSSALPALRGGRGGGPGAARQQPAPATEDLRVFSVVARKASFSAAADELGVSPAYVTKRIRILEADLGTKLLHRTTRRVTVTDDGERIYQRAQRILDEIEQLAQETAAARRHPRGLLRISSSFGFGRQRVAPVIAALVQRYPTLAVRFEVFDRLVDVAAEGFDLDVRVGDEIAPHLIAQQLALNHRVLCASPSYLARRGTPRSLADLGSHDCLVIKERDHPFGVWKLSAGRRSQSVKVTGPLSTNQGEIAVQWALGGHGIVLRSVWEVQPLLDSGELVPLLPSWRQEANVWAVMPSRLSGSAKVRVCVEFLMAALASD